MQLTQKETLYLQDAISHEQICVMKYNNYANQVQDTEISSMFRYAAARDLQDF
ncbi:MAG TPA: ferritin-like domain-containing protein [Thermoanaerobacterales bacterium]|nr:ferritin-like domain-containing protein [Thermoanaerobacterales bacterium]